MTTTTDYTALDTKLAEMGFTLTAKFVPQSLSRNRDQKDKSLNWLVTVERNGKKLTTDYMQGIGHVPRYHHRVVPSSYGPQQIRQRQEESAETGKYYVDPGRHITAHKPLPEPALRDVLNSLLLDAEVRDYTFSEWCREFGYDDDSIKARRLYDACVDIAAELNRMITTPEKETLHELFQDY